MELLKLQLSNFESVIVADSKIMLLKKQPIYIFSSIIASVKRQSLNLQFLNEESFIMLKEKSQLIKVQSV